ASRRARASASARARSWRPARARSRPSSSRSRGRNTAREVEEPLRQRRQMALHLRDREDVGVLRLHVAEVDGVAGLGAVEARLLGDGDAEVVAECVDHGGADTAARRRRLQQQLRSEEHTSELQSRSDLVCRLLLEKKKDRRLLCLLHSLARPPLAPTLLPYTTLFRSSAYFACMSQRLMAWLAWERSKHASSAMVTRKLLLNASITVARTQPLVVDAFSNN